MAYKITTSILFLSLFLKNLSAQEPSKEAKRQFALNSYIDYLNFSSDNLLDVAFDAQNVYTNMQESYYDVLISQYADKDNKTLSIPMLWGKRGNNFLENNYKKDILDYDSWHNIVLRIFDSISSFNKFLQNEEQQIIYPQLQKLHTIYLNIYKQYEALDHYLDNRNTLFLNGTLSHTSGYNDSVNIYKCLDSIAYHFKAFKITKDILEKNITSLQEKNIPEKWKQSGFYKIMKASKPLLNTINIFCNKIYSGDTLGLQKNIEELTNLKIALTEMATPILDTMFTFNRESGTDPRFRFNEYIALVDKFIILGKKINNIGNNAYIREGKNNIIGFYNREVIWIAFHFERAFNEFTDLANGKKRLDEALCCYSDNPHLDKTVSILPEISYVPVRFDTHHSLKEDTNQINNTKILTDSIEKLISISAFSHLVLLLDVSSSMKAPDRLDVLKNALDFIINYLRKEDKISIVLFSGTASVVIENISGVEKKILVQTIDQLQSHGSTNADAGIKMAYEIAKKYFIPNGNNRIVVGTDGDFSLNNQSKNIIKELASTGIALSCLLFGKDANATVINFLEQISEKGNGHFYKVDSSNAKDVLLKEVTSVKLN